MTTPVGFCDSMHDSNYKTIDRHLKDLIEAATMLKSRLEIRMTYEDDARFIDRIRDDLNEISSAHSNMLINLEMIVGHTHGYNECLDDHDLSSR